MFHEDNLNSCREWESLPHLVGKVLLKGRAVGAR